MVIHQPPVVQLGDQMVVRSNELSRRFVSCMAWLPQTKLESSVMSTRMSAFRRNSGGPKREVSLGFPFVTQAQKSVHHQKKETPIPSRGL